ncbi:hypothetical protein CY34DRAFT_16658 [Suillus luteus UH-Slu-Lm8-n1]|uniref:Uncharacterized protein n=1 Tax=Suillus luteus UH-Slu-Lm8-n1 TaxID=930992 RepID=A0A0D0AD52_9AGAM|nr:hypothetical protein CY34DRAFT_16658 [Suillus luteus UH-Slu-Lm8-n1]
MPDSDYDSPSASESLSGNSLLSDSEDEDKAVALPSEGATLEHYRKYIQYLQLQKGVHGHAPVSNASSVSSVPTSMTSTATTGNSDTLASEKVFMDLGKKYALTVKMFMLDDSIFKLPCPDPPINIQSPSHYAKTSVEKAALITELYGCIDHTLHPHMPTMHFINKFCSGMQRVRSSYIYTLRSVAGSILEMPSQNFAASFDRAADKQMVDAIGWVAGKGKDFNVLDAPIIYPNLKVNAKKVFGNWLVIAKFIKITIGGKMSIYSKPGCSRGPNPYLKLWKLKGCTPGLIACGVTALIFILSPDQQFPGSGTGTISSISYSTVFRTVKRFFIIQWSHSRVQEIIKNLNNYIFEDVDMASRDVSQDVVDACTDLSDSLDRVMACLDDDNSSGSDDDNRMAAPIALGHSATHIPVPAAVVVTPALNLTQTVVNTLSQLTMDQHAFSGPSAAPVSIPISPPVQITNIPVTIVPQNTGGESISSEVKGRKRGQRKSKTLNSDAPPCRSSRKT